MAVLIEALEAEGYVDGESIFGAPYDFRYAPGKHASHVASSFLRDLKGLIEIAYMNNGKQPVIILSHSLGGLWALHFLRQQSLTWQQEYIGHFIAVSTPWGGTVQSMKIFASGYAEGAPFINPLLLRAEQRSSESNLWLLPTPATFDKQVLVTTERDSYSACDISRFLEDVGYPEGVPLYESRIPALVESLNPPFIPVTIVYSDGIDTPLMLAYGRKGFEHQPLVTYGDGDGTVNLQSLMGVLNRWKALQGEDLEVINLHGKTHSTILTDKQAVNTLVEIVLSKPRHAEILS
ncbi:hypothetical protein KP509_25G060800 [Ceratopteris richardii]|nr:hypothetical protein KP509_25G060800 [Ceratopteris richardii]